MGNSYTCTYIFVVNVVLLAHFRERKWFSNIFAVLDEYSDEADDDDDLDPDVGR